jgi:hypothetical protein
MPDVEYAWDPLTPDEARALLGPLGIRYWIAGGWAIDLFLGRRTRTHGDIDVAMLRGDVPALLPLLGDWEICIAHGGTLTPWDGGALAPEHHQYWARRRGSSAWRFEVLLECHDGDRWIYRRDDRITLPLHRFGRTTGDGVPYISPEVALLYKSRRPGHDIDRNAADFTAAAPALDDEARTWLRDALSMLSPEHPWLGRLGAPPTSNV